MCFCIIILYWPFFCEHHPSCILNSLVITLKDYFYKYLKFEYERKTYILKKVSFGAETSCERAKPWGVGRGLQQEVDLDGLRHCQGPRVPCRAEICAQGHRLQVGHSLLVSSHIFIQRKVLPPLCNLSFYEFINHIVSNNFFAPRNCLVNSSRTVKLADFGMTRPMFESDYYRFSKKGNCFYIETSLNNIVYHLESHI